MANMLFAKGDLVHVPQAAVMFGSEQKSARIYINQKPTLAIFVDYTDGGMSRY